MLRPLLLQDSTVTRVYQTLQVEVLVSVFVQFTQTCPSLEA
jgi:hypothetical protein